MSGTSPQLSLGSVCGDQINCIVKLSRPGSRNVQALCCCCLWGRSAVRQPVSIIAMCASAETPPVRRRIRTARVMFNERKYSAAANLSVVQYSRKASHEFVAAKRAASSVRSSCQEAYPVPAAAAEVAPSFFGSGCADPCRHACTLDSPLDAHHALKVILKSWMRGGD